MPNGTSEYLPTDPGTVVSVDTDGIHFTNPPGSRCDCCWRDRDDDGQPLTIGTIQMPQRRPFRVCSDCVNFMWHARHPEVEE